MNAFFSSFVFFSDPSRSGGGDCFEIRLNEFPLLLLSFLTAAFAEQNEDRRDQLTGRMSSKTDSCSSSAVKVERLA